MRSAAELGSDDRASSAEELDCENDEREHEQEVDQATNRRQRHDAKEPQNGKYENDGPKHGGHLLLTWTQRKVRAMEACRALRRASGVKATPPGQSGRGAHAEDEQSA